MKCPKELWIAAGEFHPVGALRANLWPKIADWIKRAATQGLPSDYAARSVIPNPLTASRPCTSGAGLSGYRRPRGGGLVACRGDNRGQILSAAAAGPDRHQDVDRTSHPAG